MPNGLAHAQSPYLRQHADNPVDWQEWGEAAFARARTEDKPIFLSIGYSTCHWCHVMAHEAFENEEVAALLNDGFVAIKVDREERPDVDRVYMTYVQAMTGHGGWPLSAWLTPDLKPFYGGTYFPVEDRGGRPGFATLLRAIAGGWRDPAQRAQLAAESTRVIDALREHAASRAAPAEGDASGSDLLEAAQAAFERGYQYFNENYDARQGGFGGAPKFPRASVLSFLFRCAELQGRDSETAAEAVRMATHTLRAMARGGVHDHVGGGFHRYAVDAGWFVPHFEKMLYDQAQIAVNFLEARGATGDERYGWLARDILDYVLRDLTHPEGGFYSAEDADSQIAAGRSRPRRGRLLRLDRRRAERGGRTGAGRLGGGALRRAGGRQCAGGTRPPEGVHRQEHPRPATVDHGHGPGIASGSGTTQPAVDRGAGEPSRDPRAAAPSPPRSQDHHLLERPDDFRLGPSPCHARTRDRRRTDPLPRRGPGRRDVPPASPLRPRPRCALPHLSAPHAASPKGSPKTMPDSSRVYSISTRRPTMKPGCAGPRSCRRRWTSGSGTPTGADTSRPPRATRTSYYA
jgi:hypothetical protein